MSQSKRRTLSGKVNLTDKSPSSKKNTRPTKSAIHIPTVAAVAEKSSSRSEPEVQKAYEFLVDPDDCKPWQFHNRSEVWMCPDKCKGLIDSIKANDQKVPVFARRLENSSDGKEWEIIAGRRRWYACGRLNKKLKLKIFEGSDRDAAILMSLENKDRDNVSEFEDAVSYRDQMNAGLFIDKSDMANSLGLSMSKLSKMISAARLVECKEIYPLFMDVTQIKVNPIYKLLTAMDKSEESKKQIFKSAENLYLRFNKQNIYLKPSVIVSKLLLSSDQNRLEKSIDIKWKKESVIKSSKVGKKTLTVDIDISVMKKMTHEEFNKLLLAFGGELMGEGKLVDFHK